MEDSQFGHNGTSVLSLVVVEVKDVGELVPILHHSMVGQTVWEIVMRYNPVIHTTVQVS